MASQAEKIPSIKPGVDIYSLPLTPADGFIISCMDGSVSIEDISHISGISLEQTQRVIERLDELGVLSWSNPRDGRKPDFIKRAAEIRLKTSSQSLTSPAVSASPEPHGEDAGDSIDQRSRPSSDTATKAMQEFLATPKSGGEGKTVASPSSLGRSNEHKPPLELPAEKRQLIEHAYGALGGQTLYALLGVAQNATREQIRNAYFEKSKTFHPDSVYGMQLGTYKSMMEAVFKRITEAYETLGKKQRRQEYDEYLSATVQTAQVQEALARGVREARAIEQTVWSEMTDDKSSQQRLQGPAANGGRSTERLPVVTAAHVTGRLSSGSFPAVTQDERRMRTQQLLRRHLEGATSRTSRQSIRVPRDTGRPAESVKPSDPGDARDTALRRDRALRGLASSLKDAAVATRGQRASQQLAHAKEFEHNGNRVEAANCLKLALTFEPHRQDIAAEYERVSALVARDLAERYEKRAQYEERAGNWKLAADSWSKVSHWRPKDAYPARKAAEMMLQAGDAEGFAKKYAERAVELDPKNVSVLTVAARVYLFRGFVLNAKRELEKAIKLDPESEEIKKLLKEIP
jgi:tetratricopeptide (TPR) repeat protein